MTEEEFSKVPFHIVAHLAMENEHCCTYSSRDGRLGICIHTRKRGEFDFGRSYRHWRIDNKVYKTKAAFSEALKDFHPTMTIKKTLIQKAGNNENDN